MTIDFPERSLELDERSTCSECGLRFLENDLSIEEIEDEEDQTVLCGTCASYNE
jgi:hypothetical protein